MAAKERFDESLDALNVVESLEPPHPVGQAWAWQAARSQAQLWARPAGRRVRWSAVSLAPLAGGLTGLGVAELANPQFPDEEHDPDWGNGPARAVDHDLEDAYWREAHAKEPYYNPERRYGDYAPAYRMGWVSCARYDGGNFEKYEPAFRNDWESIKGDSRLDWDEARHAVKAGWHRIERNLPGDADGDSR